MVAVKGNDPGRRASSTRQGQGGGGTTTNKQLIHTIPVPPPLRPLLSLSFHSSSSRLPPRLFSTSAKSRLYKCWNTQFCFTLKTRKILSGRILRFVSAQSMARFGTTKRTHTVRRVYLCVFAQQKHSAVFQLS